jgi:hypothetical protein
VTTLDFLLLALLGTLVLVTLACGAILAYAIHARRYNVRLKSRLRDQAEKAIDQTLRVQVLEAKVAELSEAASERRAS